MVELHLRLPTAGRDTAGIARALTSVMVSAQVDRACGRAQLTVDAEDPRILIYIEEWSDPAGVERRIRSEGCRVLMALMETCPVRPALEFRFCSDVRGLDYVAEVRNSEPGANAGNSR